MSNTNEKYTSMGAYAGERPHKWKYKLNTNKDACAVNQRVGST